MDLQQKLYQLYSQISSYNCLIVLRSFMSKVDWKKLRPMVFDRIKQKPKDYAVKRMIPVADEVLKARATLIEGVSKLLKVVPVKSCRRCSELHVGYIGHFIRTCQCLERGAKNLRHDWMEAGINDVLVPVETFHLHDRFQNVIEHDERFEFYRVPAVVELCIQAGGELPEYLMKRRDNFCNFKNDLPFNLLDRKCKKMSKVLVNEEESCSTLVEEPSTLAQRTLQAWEIMRSRTKKLMRVYPVKVCRFCPEVHVGPIGHKVQLCRSFESQPLNGKHRWKSASLDDLIPPRNVWHVRKQDVHPLLDKWRGCYGHAPAVVELCMQGGAVIPKKYHCIMKINGLRPPSV